MQSMRFAASKTVEAGKQRRIVRRNFVKLRCQQTAERERRHNSDRQSNNDRSHSLVHNQAQHVAGLRARAPCAHRSRPCAVRRCKRRPHKFRCSRATAQRRQKFREATSSAALARALARRLCPSICGNGNRRARDQLSSARIAPVW